MRLRGPSLVCDVACGLHMGGVSSLVGCGFSCANCFREWWAGEFKPEGGRREDRGAEVRAARRSRLNCIVVSSPGVNEGDEVVKDQIPENKAFQRRRGELVVLSIFLCYRSGDKSADGAPLPRFPRQLYQGWTYPPI